MSEDETAVQNARRFVENAMAFPMQRPDMGDEEMVAVIARCLGPFDHEDLKTVAAIAMRMLIERTWDLQALVRRD